VIHYRTFRNTDPPALAAVWNASFDQRAAVQLPSATLLEYFTFAKPYFDPEGLVIAEDGDRVVGFGHAGFGSNAAGTSLDLRRGVTCALGVLPERRGRGIGSELLSRCEDYLRQRGSTELWAGPSEGLNPFTFGLYGGSRSPGFLESDPLARPFLEKRGYTVSGTSLVYRLPFQNVPEVADIRFVHFRQGYEVYACLVQKRGWWQDCVLGPIELVEYRIREKASGEEVARARVWEMDTFAHTWGEHAVGLVDLEVPPERRRQGFAKFLLTRILLHLQEQFFSLIEAQTPPDNAAMVGLLQGLGFQQSDVGHTYRKDEG
jgi:ribosomal protein S18 acetylase RimI-like enzyme